MAKTPASPTIKESEQKATIYGITAKQLPEIENWKVGEEYTLEVTVKMTGMNQYDDGPTSASFDITKVEAEDEKSENEKAFDEGFDKSR